MSQKGAHTWDIVIDYQKCPKCAWITESRKTYQCHNGKWGKEIECQRCHHRFIVTKQEKVPKIKPFFSDGESIEVDWDARE